jgi:hypothetical protein
VALAAIAVSAAVAVAVAVAGVVDLAGQRAGRAREVVPSGSCAADPERACHPTLARLPVVR